MASIGFNYGRNAQVVLWVFAGATARLQRLPRFSALQSPVKSANRRCKQKELLHLNIARTGMHIQQHAAIPDFALDMVAGHGTLHGKRTIDLQRS